VAIRLENHGMGRFSKDKRDIYYRKAKELGYRARSAFKLLQIDEKFHILDGVHRAVDLCAAPGGWSEVLSMRLKDESDGKEIKSDSDNPPAIVVAVDMMEMVPIPGVICIKGDITRQSTVSDIVSRFDGKSVDLVVCDGAPDVIGLHDVDEFVQHQLFLSALTISSLLLRPGGTFAAKIFRGKDVNRVYEKLLQFFKTVSLAKPKACRNSSIEGFVVCQGYAPPSGYTPSVLHTINLNDCTGAQACVPFVACGEGYDADQSYPLHMQVTTITCNRCALFLFLVCLVWC